MLAAVALVIVAGLMPSVAARAEGIEHLVISEIATGGAGASDEFIELFNPGTHDLPLAGLEVAYVSASGATVSQRVAWAAGARLVPPGDHVLLANEAGVHAAAADFLYHGGLAESGGTVMLRWLGAATVVDAVGWGIAAGSWLEGHAAPAPAPGSSLERLASASDGLMQDTDDNAVDFVETAVPTPQAAGVLTPAATPAPTAAPTQMPTPSPAASPAATPPESAGSSPSGTPVPLPAPVSVAAARAMADGTVVTVDGTALTGSGFGDGGGHLADGSGGIAVLVEGGSFAAGSRLVVTGTLDDRFAQRTIRTRAADVHLLGAGPLPDPDLVTTGSIGEALEGRLVWITATLRAAPTALSAGLAFEVDDGSGSVRVLVASATGIDISSWATGHVVELVGVVGQRDSSGSGASGYRVQPRTSADVLRVVAPLSAPSPSAAATVGPTPSPAAPSAPVAVTPIGTARTAPAGTRLTLRGVVTLPLGIVDAETAVIQDETGAIVLRVDAEMGPLREGDVIEVDGVRSTKSGMETLRASSPPRVLGSGASAVIDVMAADVTEGIEARLVALTGQLVGSARRAASGTVSFDLADATGIVRVVLAASLRADDTALVAGAEVEVVGIVGQETTVAEPLAGYRIWPRTAAEVRIVAPPQDELAAPAGRAGGSAFDEPARSADTPSAATPNRTLESVGTIGLGDLRVGATLVAAAWPELGIGGLLWDGTRLVAVSADSASGFVALGMRPPIPLALSGLRLIGVEPRSSVPVVALGAEAGAFTLVDGPPAAPRVALPSQGEPAAWVTLVGRLVVGDGVVIEFGQATVSLDILCGSPMPVPEGMVSVTGIGLADPARLIVPCDGIRAAPILARTILAATDDPRNARAVPPVQDEERGASASSDRRRTLAAWLLALAVLVVAGATLVWRRLPAAPDAEPAEDDRAETDASDVPQLTLVRLRRERGS